MAGTRTAPEIIAQFAGPIEKYKFLFEGNDAPFEIKNRLFNGALFAEALSSEDVNEALLTRTLAIDDEGLKYNSDYNDDGTSPNTALADALSSEVLTTLIKLLKEYKKLESLKTYSTYIHDNLITLAGDLDIDVSGLPDPTDITPDALEIKNWLLTPTVDSPLKTQFDDQKTQFALNQIINQEKIEPCKALLQDLLTQEIDRLADFITQTEGNPQRNSDATLAALISTDIDTLQGQLQTARDQLELINSPIDDPAQLLQTLSEVNDGRKARALTQEDIISTQIPDILARLNTVYLKQQEHITAAREAKDRELEIFKLTLIKLSPDEQDPLITQWNTQADALLVTINTWIQTNITEAAPDPAELNTEIEKLKAIDLTAQVQAAEDAVRSLTEAQQAIAHLTTQLQDLQTQIQDQIRKPLTDYKSPQERHGANAKIERLLVEMGKATTAVRDLGTQIAALPATTPPSPRRAAIDTAHQALAVLHNQINQLASPLKANQARLADLRASNQDPDLTGMAAFGPDDPKPKTSDLSYGVGFHKLYTREQYRQRTLGPKAIGAVFVDAAGGDLFSKNTCLALEGALLKIADAMLPATPAPAQLPSDQQKLAALLASQAGQLAYEVLKRQGFAEKVLADQERLLGPASDEYNAKLAARKALTTLPYPTDPQAYAKLPDGPEKTKLKQFDDDLNSAKLHYDEVTQKIERAKLEFIVALTQAKADLERALKTQQAPPLSEQEKAYIAALQLKIRDLENNANLKSDYIPQFSKSEVVSKGVDSAGVDIVAHRVFDLTGIDITSGAFKQQPKPLTLSTSGGAFTGIKRDFNRATHSIVNTTTTSFLKRPVAWVQEQKPSGECLSRIYPGDKTLSLGTRLNNFGSAMAKTNETMEYIALAMQTVKNFQAAFGKPPSELSGQSQGKHSAFDEKTTKALLWYCETQGISLDNKTKHTLSPNDRKEFKAAFERLTNPTSTVRTPTGDEKVKEVVLPETRAKRP